MPKLYRTWFIEASNTDYFFENTQVTHFVFCWGGGLGDTITQLT